MIKNEWIEKSKKEIKSLHEFLKWEKETKNMDIEEILESCWSMAEEDGWEGEELLKWADNYLDNELDEHGDHVISSKN